MFKALADGIRSLVARKNDKWDYTDRRRLVRLRCHYDVKAQSGKKSFDATIVDMGLKGLCLRCFEPLKPGQKVRVSTPVPIVGAESRDVECEVIWNRQPDRNFLTYAGMKYVSDDKVMGRSWVKYFLRELGFTNELIYSQRKFVRADCILDVVLTPRGAPVQRGKIYNLGIGGALIEVGQPLERGLNVELQIGPHESMPNFRARGTIVKVDKEANRHLVGVKFGQLSTDELRILSIYLKHFLAGGWQE